MKGNTSTFLGIFLITIFFTFCHCNSSSEDYIISKADSPYHLYDDLETNKYQRLIIEAGAHVLLDDEVNILAFGDVIIQGTEDEPVIIEAINSDVGWGKISAKGETENFIIDYAEISGGIITSFDSDNKFSNSLFSNSQDLTWESAIIRFWYGSADIDNCQLNGVNKAEGILLHDVHDASIKNCVFDHVPDAIELLNCKNGIIENNKIMSSGDDGIDLNHCNGTIIRNNIIDIVADSGMEIGSENFGRSTNIKTLNNKISNCQKGLWIKESAEVVAEHDSIIGNVIGVEAITSPDSSDVSMIILRNCILLDNSEDTKKDDQSIITIEN